MGEVSSLACLCQNNQQAFDLRHHTVLDMKVQDLHLGSDPPNMDKHGTNTECLYLKKEMEMRSMENEEIIIFSLPWMTVIGAELILTLIKRMRPMTAKQICKKHNVRPSTYCKINHFANCEKWTYQLEFHFYVAVSMPNNKTMSQPDRRSTEFSHKSVPTPPVASLRTFSKTRGYC